jgi:hypothetical protein
VVPTNKPGLAGPSRPLGSPEIPQRFLPATAEKGVYAPFLYGSAKVQFADRRRKIDETRLVAFMVPIPSAKTVDWDAAVPVTEPVLDQEPRKAPYLPLPAGAMDTTVFARWAKAFDRWVARTQKLEVPPRPEAPDVTAIGPRRGGVTVDLVAVVWVLG